MVSDSGIPTGTTAQRLPKITPVTSAAFDSIFFAWIPRTEDSSGISNTISRYFAWKSTLRVQWLLEKWQGDE